MKIVAFSVLTVGLKAGMAPRAENSLSSSHGGAAMYGTRQVLAGLATLLTVGTAQAQFGSQTPPQNGGQVMRVPAVQPVAPIPPVQPVAGFGPAPNVFGERPQTWQERLRSFLVRWHIMKPVPDPPISIPGNDYQSPARTIGPQRLLP